MGVRVCAAGAAAVVLSGAALVGAAPAATADDKATGTCSASSTWESDLELERRTWDLEFEVKTQQPGQRWRLTVMQNGSNVYSQTRRAALEDGDDTPAAEAKWTVRRADHPNMRETFVLRAKNLKTGEVCRATLRE